MSRTPPFREVEFHSFRRYPGDFDAALHAERRERRLRSERLIAGDFSGALPGLVELIAGIPEQLRAQVLRHFCTICGRRKEPTTVCDCAGVG